MATPEKIVDNQERPSPQLLSLKPDCSFSGFLEGLEFCMRTCLTAIDIPDPNWFEDGEYKWYRLEKTLLEDLERYFRSDDQLRGEEQLIGKCYYTSKRDTPSHGDLLVGFTGTDHDDDVPLIGCWLDDNTQPLDVIENA